LGEIAMINEPRIYRRSPIQFILVMVVLVIFGIGILTTFPRTEYIALILFALIIGAAFISALYTMTQKTAISDDGISAQTIFGGKSLRWGEISRVSGRGYRIKLHNFDGDVTVTPSAQLPGYEEVVEWIGIKRPDLFNPLEYGEMKRSMSGLVLLVIFMLVLLGAGVALGLLYFSEPGTPVAAFTPLLFIAVVFIVFLGITLFQPQSLTLEGKSLRVKYLFNERTLLADEIASIDLRYSQSRNGKSYFVQLSQTNKKTVRISGLSPSLPIVYLVLKNWHGKNSAIGLTIQRN
jgi:hypothetical protein